MPRVTKAVNSAAELDRLAQALQEYQAVHQATTQRLETVEEQLRAAQTEQAFWEQMAVEADQAKAGLENRLAVQQMAAATRPAGVRTKIVTAANAAASAVQLDEVETRKLVDEQLRQAGWQADSATLTQAKGARPEKGKNLAIAEWSTMSGPADYVLFVGLTPVAIVEAKRKHRDVSAALQQAKRYSRAFTNFAGLQPPGGPWGKHRVPFVFSTNGRPYLRQLATLSGIWFCDLRRPENLAARWMAGTRRRD